MPLQRGLGPCFQDLLDRPRGGLPDSRAAQLRTSGFCEVSELGFTSFRLKIVNSTLCCFSPLSCHVGCGLFLKKLPVLPSVRTLHGVGLRYYGLGFKASKKYIVTRIPSAQTSGLSRTRYSSLHALGKQTPVFLYA